MYLTKRLQTCSVDLTMQYNEQRAHHVPRRQILYCELWSGRSPLYYNYLRVVDTSTSVEREFNRQLQLASDLVISFSFL